jgi:Zn-finger in ubiquitin-hydrolases and other protein
MEEPKSCAHILNIHTVKVEKQHVCEECIKIHSHWLHLRTCQTCGATLCCDNSPHKHMTQHYHKTGHPVITSAEPGERWFWCYPDEVFAEY